MTIDDGILIDLIRGELDARTAQVVREALQADPALRARFDAVSRTFALSRKLPAIQPQADFAGRLSAKFASLAGSAESPAFGALVDYLKGELDDTDAARLRELMTRDPELDARRREIESVLAAARAVGYSAEPGVRSTISGRLRAVIQTSDEDAAVPRDLALLTDYHRGELTAAENRQVSHRIRINPRFARKSRSVERTLRLLRTMTIEPSVALARSSRLVADRAAADTLAEPPAQTRTLIDYTLGELPAGDFEAIAGKLRSDPALAAERLRIERLFAAVASLPAIEPSAALRERIAAKLRELLTEGEQSRRTAIIGEAMDLLRGELHGEHAEAIAESGDGRVESARALDTTLGSLPHIDPSDKFRRRLAKAIAGEVKVARKAAKKRTALIPVQVARLPEGRLLKLPQVRAADAAANAERRLAKGNLFSLASARPAAAALIVHAVGIAALWFVVLESPFSGETTLGQSIGASHEMRLPVDEGDDIGNPLDIAALGNREIPANNIVYNVSGEVLFTDSPSSESEFDTFLHPSNPGNAAVLYETIQQPDMRLPALTGVARSYGGEMFSVGYNVKLHALRRANADQKARRYGAESSKELRDRLAEMHGYLVRAQKADGSWGADHTSSGMKREGEPWQIESRRLENTGLALLALLGDGYSLKHDTEQRTINRAVDYLLSIQNESGGFGFTAGAFGNKRAQPVLQSDAIITLALAEAYAGGNGQRVKTAMGKALVRLMAGQLAKNSETDVLDVGGFPYAVGEPADMVTGAWVIQALEAARAAGWFNTGYPAAANAFRAYVEANTGVANSRAEDDRDYIGIVGRPGLGYTPMSGERKVAAGTSAAMVAELLSGAANELSMTLRSQTGYLMSPLLMPSNRGLRAPSGVMLYKNSNYTAWYFATLAMYQGGISDDEQAYLSHLHTVLFKGVDKDSPTHFVAAGDDRGSFLAVGEEEELHGRVFSTALAALCIENAYRAQFDTDR